MSAPAAEDQRLYARAGHDARPRAARLALAGVAACLLPYGSAVTAHADAAVPANNLTTNPSFEVDTAGWAGIEASVRQVGGKDAPDGHRAARVKGTGADFFGIDDSPSTIPLAGGASSQYTALASVRGSRRTAKRKVELVVSEVAVDGAVVGEGRSTARLPRKRFKNLTVNYTPVGSDNQIDIRVIRSGKAGRRDSFLVDAISLIPRSSVTTTGQLAFTFPHEAQLVDELGSRYRTAVVRDIQHSEVSGFQAANPGTDLLAYKNAGFVVNDPSCKYEPTQSSGVSYCDASSHEEWFLHDKDSGERIVPGAYDYHFAMDVGNPDYQRAWLDSVLKRLRDADGEGSRYDGVWIDDILLHDAHGYLDRVDMSEAEYREAMQSFIAYVGPRLQQEGFIAMPNVALQPWEGAQRAAAIEVAQNVTTITREYFVRWGSGTPLFTGNEWKQHLTLMEELMATGAGYQGIAYGSAADVQAQRYARATFLLGWNGEDGSSVVYRPDESSDPYMPDWTTDVGLPLGPRTPVGSGWKREFTDGIVVINPSASGSQGFELGGGYRQPNGACATSVTLSATRALVMPPC